MGFRPCAARRGADEGIPFGWGYYFFIFAASARIPSLLEIFRVI
jgi:hypothetical protein